MKKKSKHVAVVTKVQSWRLVYNEKLLPLELKDRVRHLEQLLEQRIADQRGVGINGKWRS